MNRKKSIVTDLDWAGVLSVFAQTPLSTALTVFFEINEVQRSRPGRSSTARSATRGSTTPPGSSARAGSDMEDGASTAARSYGWSSSSTGFTDRAWLIESRRHVNNRRRNHAPVTHSVQQEHTNTISPIASPEPSYGSSYDFAQCIHRRQKRCRTRPNDTGWQDYSC